MSASMLILLATYPIAQPTPPLIVQPIPKIASVWDSRGSLLTTSGDIFPHHAPLTARIEVEGLVAQGKVELFLNGSTKPEEIEVVGAEEGRVTVRLKRRFPRGMFRLQARYLLGPHKSVLSKPYAFQIEPPRAPAVLGVFEGDLALPFNARKSTILLQEGKDVQVELGGTLPGDEVRIFLTTEGFPQEVGKAVIEDQPIRKPIRVDLTSAMNLKMGMEYELRVVLIRDGDASEPSTVIVQVGLEPEPKEG